MPNDHAAALDRLQSALTRLTRDESSVHAFSHAARGEPELLAALPPRFADVLDDLLARLESSALFTQESCSFSPRSLTDNLQLWLDSARTRLTTN